MNPWNSDTIGFQNSAVFHKQTGLRLKPLQRHQLHKKKEGRPWVSVPYTWLGPQKHANSHLVRGWVPTCVASQGSSRDDRLVLVEVSTVTHIVLEGALGLVAGQGSGIILRVEAVIGRDTLQAVEGWLAAPGLGEAVTTIVALYALKRVLAPEFTWR